MPKRVLLTRHAEKPSDEADPRLSPAGKQRAKKLAKYIPNKFGKIDFLFASARSHESVRPIATITPLSDAIHVEINADFRDHDYAELAYHLLTDPKYRGKTVLVCWHHEYLPQLAAALGARGEYPVERYRL